MPEIENRQSVRQFSDVPVDDASLQNILDAGRRAPSAKNRQPWRFIVIDDARIRERIKDAAFGQEHVGQAPVIIAGCTTNIDYKMPNGLMSYPLDIAVAVSFMMVQSQAEGLGSCIVTTFNEPDVKEILTIPYAMRVVMLLLVGHPVGSVLSAPRKPVTDITSRNHW